jgi:hypothetical protein
VSEFPSDWVNNYLCAEIEAAVDKTAAFRRMVDKVLADKRRSYDVLDVLCSCAWSEGASEAYVDYCWDKAAVHFRRDVS